MAIRNYGQKPRYSTTAASGSDPSTAALCAELQNLDTDIYEARFVVGASTGAIWRLEHATSSGLGSSAISQQVIAFTGSNQTAEYVLTFESTSGNRLRVIPLSSFTGTYGCAIQVEKVT